MILEKIKGPAELKALSVAELNALSGEVRDALLKKLSIHGGHFGSNFGIVEATIALHYVFNSPKDKFVFDVSHQTYAHKMLTGRAEAFLDESKYFESGRKVAFDEICRTFDDRSFRKTEFMFIL